MSFFCKCALPFGLCPPRGAHRLDPLLSRRSEWYISPVCLSSSSWWLLTSYLNLAAAVAADETLCWWFFVLRLDAAVDDGDVISQFLTDVSSFDESDNSSSLSLIPPCTPDSSSDKMTVSTVSCLCCACNNFSEAMGLSRSKSFLGFVFGAKSPAIPPIFPMSLLLCGFRLLLLRLANSFKAANRDLVFFMLVISVSVRKLSTKWFSLTNWRGRLRQRHLKHNKKTCQRLIQNSETSTNLL